MGMFPFSFAGKSGFGHNGKLDGFEASLTHYPAEKLTIAYCSNGGIYQKADLLDAIVHICLNMPYRMPSFTPTLLTTSELDSYNGTYLSSQEDIKIVCTHDGNRLLLETKGFKLPVENIGSNQFMNAKFGLFFTFNQNRTELTIKEVDQTYHLFRKDQN